VKRAQRAGPGLFTCAGLAGFGLLRPLLQRGRPMSRPVQRPGLYDGTDTFCPRSLPSIYRLVQMRQGRPFLGAGLVPLGTGPFGWTSMRGDLGTDRLDWMSGEARPANREMTCPFLHTEFLHMTCPCSPCCPFCPQGNPAGRVHFGKGGQPCLFRPVYLAENFGSSATGFAF
jgi:hypothetical protein